MIKVMKSICLGIDDYIDADVSYFIGLSLPGYS
jgi:hypothetical protein